MLKSKDHAGSIVLYNWCLLALYMWDQWMHINCQPLAKSQSVFNQQAGIPLHSISIIHCCLLLSRSLSLHLTSTQGGLFWVSVAATVPPHYLKGNRLPQKLNCCHICTAPWQQLCSPSLFSSLFLQPCFIWWWPFLFEWLYGQWPHAHSLHCLIILPVGLGEELRVMNMLNSLA